MRTPIKRSDTCIVKSPSAVILYISTHGKPLVQSNDLVRTTCCMMTYNPCCRLNGCYEALEGGNTAEALIDFTGGVSETLTLDPPTLHCNADQQRALFNTLSRAHGHRALITCFIRVRQ